MGRTYVRIAERIKERVQKLSRSIPGMSDRYARSCIRSGMDGGMSEKRRIFERARALKTDVISAQIEERQIA